ncbi:MAG: hypothetical protein KIT72_06910 [Polyangiaceae bacterium]|nr:hypothetical protein [Polyangiaceae bacterium]MCW5790134.1 hypothetical protein [Polyangiaceae bacterium]
MNAPESPLAQLMAELKQQDELWQRAQEQLLALGTGAEIHMPVELLEELDEVTQRAIDPGVSALTPNVAGALRA